MTFNGWAVNLNGVLLVRSCDATQEDWDALGCAPAVVLDGLTSIPEGLDLPDLRTEDVTYFQRDGAKHFSDWYVPRTIIVQGTLGPASPEDCADCSPVREQLQELVQAWKRACCDTELVLYTDCYDQAIPTIDPDLTVIRENLFINPGAEAADTLTMWDSKDATRFTDSLNTTTPISGSQSVRTTRQAASLNSTASEMWVGKDATFGFPVTAGQTYTVSVDLRVGSAAAALKLNAFEIRWLDVAGSPVSSTTSTPGTALTVDEVVRGSLSGVAPVGATNAWLYLNVQTVSGANASAGDIVDYDNALAEESASAGEYFDGSFPDSNDFVIGGQQINYEWVGAANASHSTETVYTYEAGETDVSLGGPFGIVGRPRSFKYEWINREEQIVDFVGRFDAVDQRMYILDGCGTPGYAQCVEIEPGSQIFSLCMTDGTGIYAGQKVVCNGPGGVCMTTPVIDEDSVEPTEVNVGGTERVYPTITLSPNLISPRVENLTTEEWVGYDGTVSDLPITINTEEGTAFDSEGNSLTHLLRGSMFLSMDPGNYEWRLLTAGEPEEPGTASLCFRPTVVNA